MFNLWALETGTKCMILSRYIMFSSILFFLTACSASDNSQPQGMLKEDLNCPNRSTGQIERWGGFSGNGWMHSCKIQHGAFRVWRNQNLFIEGQHRWGEQVGKWTYYKDNGEIEKIVHYKK